MPNDISLPAAAELLERGAAATELPAGEYAIVELFGHTVLVGRIAEIKRFGIEMLVIEPLFNGSLLDPVYHGGAAIYRLTPCSAEVAAAKQPRDTWALPSAIRATLPPLALAAPSETESEDELGDEF